MTSSPIFFFILSLTVYFTDQVSKLLVIKNLVRSGTIKVTPFFNLVYVENVGSAFGMFKSLGNTFFIAVSIGAAIFIAVLIFKDAANRWAYGLLLGGALGNMTDRIAYGFVVDFLDFHVGGYHWYVFNIADAALTVGMVLLLIKAFFPKTRISS